MKKETLKTIRKTLNKLIPIISAYRDANQKFSNLLVSIQVTLQNMCFDWNISIDYTHEDDIEKFEKHYNFLKELKDSSFTFHFIDFVLDEVEMCIEGNMMSEWHEDMISEMDNYEDERRYDEQHGDDFDIRTANLEEYSESLLSVVK